VVPLNPPKKNNQADFGDNQNHAQNPATFCESYDSAYRMILFTHNWLVA